MYHAPEGGVRGREICYPEAQLSKGPGEEQIQCAPTVDEDFFEEHLLDGCVEDERETPCVGYVRPLVSPTEGDGDLGPWAIAGVVGGFL